MKNPRLLAPLFAAAVTLGFSSACSQQAQQPAAPPPDLSGIEANIRSMDKDWSAASAAKDADKASSYYADDAEFLAPAAPAAVGRDAIHKAWAGMLASPDFVTLTFAPSVVHVAQAGDIAYEIGTYDFMMKDKKGKPLPDKGKFVVVWKKQADGSWKVEADIFNSDLR
jgi:uncharacterized protein (TIGR02246 family)